MLSKMSVRNGLVSNIVLPTRIFPMAVDGLLPSAILICDGFLCCCDELWPSLIAIVFVVYWVYWFRTTAMEYTNVNLDRVVQLLHASHKLATGNSHNNYNSNNNYNGHQVIPNNNNNNKKLDTPATFTPILVLSNCFTWILEYVRKLSHSTLISPLLLPQFESYQTESHENYMYCLKTIPCL